MSGGTHTVYADHHPDWYTPPEWVSWVVATLGPGYWDPCPADHDGKRDGLAGRWPDQATYVNHPGGRGQAQRWWVKSLTEGCMARVFCWCAFNAEQLRILKPSPLELPGWLVLPRSRTAFVDSRTGELGKSPSNWAVWWVTTEPATPPVSSIVIRTGGR